MRLLTPFSALVTAVAIATASTGLVVHRSADQPPSGEFRDLIGAPPASTPEGAEATTPEVTPTHAGSASSTSTNVSDVPAGPTSTTASSPSPEVRAAPSPIGSHAQTEPAVIADDGLFIIDPDTAKARQITDGAIYDVEWLSEGRIAYIRGATLWLADADGSDKREVHPGVVDGGFRDLAVSPDGRWIAFVSSAGSRERPVWLMRSDGSAARKIWDDTLNSSIGWAPDSKRLAFVSGGDETLGVHVYDMEQDSTTLVYGGFVNSPVWTPSGTEIICWDGSILAVNAATKEYRSIVNTSDLVWTLVLDPSGLRVVYTDHGALQAVPVTSGPPERISSTVGSFDWTRSGDRAAFVQRTGEQDFDGRWITKLSVGKPDFSDGRTIALAGTYASIYGPTWSPER